MESATCGSSCGSTKDGTATRSYTILQNDCSPSVEFTLPATSVLPACFAKYDMVGNLISKEVKTEGVSGVLSVLNVTEAPVYLVRTLCSE